MPSKTVKFSYLPLDIQEDKLLIDEEIFILKFPDRLYHSIILNRTDNYKYLYIKPFSKFIRAKFSSIITTEDTIRYESLKNPWIYSFEPCDIEYIRCLLKEWIELQFGSIKAMMALESIEELEWEKTKVELDFRINSQGTSNPSTFAFRFFPAYIGHKISGKLEANIQNETIGFDEIVSNYKFYYVSSSEQQTELISWPPKKKRIDGEDGEWAYKVVLTLQTIPFSPIPYISIETRLLRICTDKIITRKGKGLAPYIKLPESYIRGNATPVFIDSYMKSFYNKEEDKNEWFWDKGFMSILESLGLQGKIPDIYELLKNPASYINVPEGVSVIVPFGTHIFGSNIVASGVTYIDRVNITDAVREYICASVCPNVSKKVGNFVILENSYEGRIHKGIYKVDNLGLGKLPNTFRIQLYYNDPRWLEKARRALFDMLENEYLIDNKEGFIELTSKWNKEIIKKLFFDEIDVKQWNGPEKYFFDVKRDIDSYQDFSNSLNKRIKNIMGKDNNQKIITGSLFELPDSDAFDKKIDPKATIRKVLADYDILSQFITPTNTEFDEDIWAHKANRKKKKVKSDKYKFVSGTWDLMRQFGIIDMNISAFTFTKDKETLHVGLWFYCYKIDNFETIDFPILVAIYKNEPYVAFFREGVENNYWLKYADAQLLLATNPGYLLKKLYNFNKDQIEKSKRPFVVMALRELSMNTGNDNIILYTVAQNCRQYIQWFKNPLISTNKVMLTINKEKSSCNDYECESDAYEAFKTNNYSVVRLRNNTRGEAPQWTRVKFDQKSNCISNMPTSNISGIFGLNKYVYYSIPPRLKTMGLAKHVSISTKENIVDEEFKKMTTMEVCIPYISASDCSASEFDIAIMTHMLRNGTSIQFDESTKYPLPVHLAEKICEYADAYFSTSEDIKKLQNSKKAKSIK